MTQDSSKRLQTGSRRNRIELGHKVTPIHARGKVLVVVKNVSAHLVLVRLERIHRCLVHDRINQARPQVYRLTLEILDRVDKPMLSP